ncbi:MAG: phage tail assembly chaperone [Propylenella sp.]
MGFGFGVLRLTPVAFWGMTLKEMAAAMKATLPDFIGGLGKAQLDELMRRYPDG